MSSTIEKVLSNHNMSVALSELMLKKDTCGADGMYLHELPEYLRMNKDVLRECLLKGEYKAGSAKMIEIVGKNGKRRKITLVNTVDRYISRCIFNVIAPMIAETQSEYSYAYQSGKSIQKAAGKCRDYALLHPYVLYIDFADYFGSINHERLNAVLFELLRDRKLVSLIADMVHPPVIEDFELQYLSKGIIQGSVLSPCISNLYLNEFDRYLETNHYDFVRYADYAEV